MDLRVAVVLAIVAASNAGPINVQRERQCSTQCVEATKFKYNKGGTYRYDYEGNVLTTVFGASEGASGMRLKATADIEVIDSCDFALTLRNVRLEETDKTGRTWSVLGAESFRRALEADPVRFAFQDGRIEDVCPAPNEKPWLTNIKRGVLSAFQNNMDDFQKEDEIPETDVAGNCRAQYKIMSRQYTTVTINKTKDLLACTDRHGFKSAMQATPYRVPSDIQSLPLTKSSHACVQTISTVSGHMMKANCEEKHVFRPFSKENNGAMTHAKHSLEFVGMRPGVRTSLGGTMRRTSMLFEHEKEEPKTTRNTDAIEETLNTICQETKDDVRPETPRLFSDLVYKMKELEPITLKRLHRQIISKGVCRNNHDAAKKYFHDALPMAGTPAAVSLISELVNQRHVRGSEADMWVSSLAFIQHPTKEMLESVKALINAPNPSKSAYLAGSALANNYCKKNQGCTSEPAITQLINLLERNLNWNCKVGSRSSREQIIMSLKALANMANAPSTADTLARCFSEESNPIEIRLGALDALKKQPCTANRSPALRLFVNQGEDSELRIAGYITAMSCADERIIDTVQRTLESEPVNQVGSYVWTHLTNLMETGDRNKQRIKQILDSVTLKKSFDLDKRKYSRNLEASMFFDSINTGAKVDGNLIWSTKSYIPRSAMFNLTVDLFGESVNLMEFGGRAEGLEHMAEKYFGTGGHFADVGDMMQERRKRSLSEDKMNIIENQYNSEKSSKPKGSLYFKLFGQEIRYLDFAEMGKGGDINILEVLLMLARNHDINYSKSIMFLDTTMTIPTVTGLPLKLTINGTATINMQIQGKLDIRRLHPSPRTMDISGTFKPSAAIEVSSLMAVDANVARTGLKMVTTLHSSSVIKGKIQMQESQAVNVEFEMPREKTEILKAENKFFIVHQASEVEQQMINSNRVDKSRCTGAGLAKVLGVEFCGTVSYPTTPEMVDVPVFPLTGPAKMSIVMNKKDTHSGYKFEAILKTNKVRKEGKTLLTHVARIGFNTPGSRVDREFLLDFTLDRGDKALNFELKSPWKKANLNGALVTQDDLKRATLRLMVDETKQYSMTAEMQIDATEDRKTYTPNLEIVMPGREPILLAGSATYTKAPDMALEYSLNIQQLFTTPVMMNGFIRKEVSRGDRQRYNTDFKLESPLLKTNVSGFLDAREDNYKSRMTVLYQWEKRRREAVSLSFKGRNTLTETMRKILFDTAITLSAYPNYNSHLKWDAQTTNTHFETSVDLKYGPDPSDKTKKVTASTIVNYERFGRKFNADARVKFFMPAKNIDVEFAGKHHHDSRSLETKAELQYTADKSISAQVNALNHGGRHMKYSGGASLSYPGRELAVSTKFEQTKRYEFHTSSRLQWQTGKEIRENSLYKYEEQTHLISSTIEIPDILPISIDGSLKPKMDNFAAMLKVNAMDETYMGDVAYNYNKQGQQFTGTGSVDVLYPGRHIVGSGEISASFGGEYSTKADLKWDADNDETKALVIEGQYKYQRYSYLKKHEALANIQYPGRVIVVQMNAEKGAGIYKTDGLVDWGTNKLQMGASFIHKKTRLSRELSGTFNFTSPFKYFEKLGAGMWYRKDSEAYKAGADVTWAPQKSISSEVVLTMESLKDMEFAIGVATPFDQFNNMGLKGKYLHQDKELSVIIGGQSDDRRIEMEVTGKYKNSIEGALKLDLPFLSRQFGASFSHKGENKNYISTAEVSWDRINKIMGQFNLVMTSVNDFSGTIQLETPFENFNRAGVLLTHLIQDGEMTSKISGNFGEKQMAIEVKGKKDNSYSRRDMEGSIRITTPFENFDDMSLALKHNDDGHIFTSSMSAAWQRTKRVTASFYMKHRRQGWSLNNQGKIQITTPYDKFKRVGYEWEHANTKKDVSTEHTVNINSARYGFGVTGEYQTNDGIQFHTSLNIQTPGPQLRRTTFSFDYEHNTEKMITSFEVTYGKGRSTGSLNLRGDIYEITGSGNLDIDVLFLDERLLQPLTMELQTRARSMPYSGFIKVASPSEEVRLEVTTTPRSLKRFDGKITLKTPWENYETLSAEVKHRIVRRSSESSITVIYPADTTVKVEMNSNFESKDKIKADLTVTAPFDSIRLFKAELDHDRDYRGFTDKVDFQYENKDGKTALVTELTYYGKRYVSGNIQFTSPIEGYESVGVGFTHQGQTRKMDFKSHLEYMTNKKLIATALVEYDPVRVTLTLTTPFEELSSARLNVEHDGTYPETTSALNFVGSVLGEEIKLSGTAEVTSRRQMGGNFRLETPYEGYTDVKGEFNYKRERDEALATIGISLGEGKAINLATSYKIPALSCSIRITTPFSDYEEITAGYTFEKSESDNGLLSIVAKANAVIGQAFSFEVEGIVAGPKSMKGKIAFSTPLPDGTKYSLLLNTEYLWKEDKKYDIAAILEYPGGKNEVSFVFQPITGSQPLILYFKVKTPSYFLSSLTFDLEHTGTWRSFEHKLIFDYDAYISRVHIENTWNVDGLNHIVGEARMTSPIKHMEYTGFSINHQKDEMEWATSGTLEYSPGKRINFKNEIKFDDKFELDAEFTTPFKIARIAAVKIEHEGGYYPFKNELTLEFDDHKLTSELEVESLESIHGDMKYTNSADRTKKVTMKMTHEMQGQEAVSNVEIKLPSSEKIEVDVITRLGSTESVKIELHTPYDALRRATLEYSQRLSIWMFKLLFDMTNFGESIHLDGNFKMPVMGEFSGDVHFTSNYENFKDISIDASNELSGAAYVSEATARFNSKVIRLTSNIDIEKVTYNINLVTPFDVLQSASFIFEHKGGSPEYSPNVSYLLVLKHTSTKGTTEFRSDWSMNISPHKRIYNMNVKFTSPYEIARLISYNGNAKYQSGGGEGHYTYRYNEKTVEYNAAYSRGKEIMWSYSLKTPWEYAREVEWNIETSNWVNDDFTWKDFSIKTDVYHNMLETKMKGAMAWKITDQKKEFSTSASSQFFDDLALTIKHTKLGLRLCTFEGEASMGTNKVIYDSKMNFGSLEKFSAYFKLNFPYPGMTMRRNELSFAHEGTLEEFKSSAMFDTNTFGKFAVELDWVTATMSGLLKFDTPYTGWETIHLNFKHEGDLDDFTTTVTANIPNKQATLTAVFKMSPMNLDVQFTSPIEKFENMHLIITHTGEMERFTSTAEVQYMTGKTISARANFNMMDNINLNLNLKTPFEVAKELSLVYTHEGDLKKFECNAEAKYNNEKTITGKLKFMSEPTIDVRLELNTPFEDFTENFIQVTHSGELSDFTSTLDAKIMKPLTGRIEFQGIKPKIILKAEMTTPYEHLRNPKIDFRYRGNSKNFRSSLTAEVGPIPINANLNFQVRRGYLSLTGDTNIPELLNQFIMYGSAEKVKIELNHNGMYKDFVTDLKLFKDDVEMIKANVAFKNVDELSLKAQLHTPYNYLEETILELDHSKEGKRYITSAKAIYNSGDTITAKVDLLTSPNVELKAEMTSPYEGYDDMSVVYIFNGNSRRFTATGTAKTYRQQEVGFRLDYTNYSFRRLLSTLTVYTPLTGYESVTAKVTHSGTQSMFKTVLSFEDARNRKVEGTMEFNRSPLALTAKFISPYMVFNLAHSGEASAFQTSGDLEYNEMEFKANAMFNMRGYVGSLNVYTPWTDVMISHSGNYSKFKSNVTYTYQGEKMEVVATFDKNSAMALLMYNCPRFSGRIMHNGRLTSFRSSATITYNGKTITALGTFSKDTKISGTATFTSPYKYAENLALSFNHFGGRRQFRSDGKVQWAAGKVISGEMEFRTSRRVVASNVKVSTPFPGYETLSFNLNHYGIRTQFRTTLGLQYMTGKEMQMTTTYQDRTRGTFTFTSPIKHINTISASFHKAQVQNKDGYHAEFSWEPQKTILADVAYELLGELKSLTAIGYLRLRTPFTEIQEVVVDIDHSHSEYFLRSKLDLDHNSAPLVHAEVTMRREEKSYSAEALMSAPLPMKATARFYNNKARNEHNANFNMEVNWNTRDDNSKVMATVYYNSLRRYRNMEYKITTQLRVPNRIVTVKTEMKKSPTSLEHMFSISPSSARVFSYKINHLYRLGTDESLVDGSITVQVPSRTLKSTYHYERNLRTILASYAFDWGKKAELKLKVDDYRDTYGTNFELTFLPPRMTQGIILRNEVTRQSESLETKTEFIYSQNADEKITLHTRWGVMSTGPHNNYTSMISLTQPRTLTDIMLEGHAGTSYSAMTMGTNMEYLTANRKREIVSLRTEIDHAKNTLTFNLLTPLKNVRMVGTKSNIENGYFLTHQSVHDEVDSVSSNLKLDLSVPSFDYKVNYDPENDENMFKMYGKYLSNKEVIFEMFRQHEQRHISEIHLSARLNSTRVLHSRIHWRPTLWSDIKKTTLACFEESHPIMQAWNRVKGAVSKEIELRASIYEEAMPDMTPVMDFIKNEMDSFTSDGQDFMDALEAMYDNNDFFIQNITDYSLMAANYIAMKTTILRYEMRMYIADFQRSMSTKTAQWRRTWTAWSGKVEEQIAAVVLKFRPAWQSYAYTVIKGYETTAQKVNDQWEDILVSADQSWVDFVKTMDKNFDYISFKMEAYLDKVKELQDKLRAKLMSSKPKRWLDKVKEKVIIKVTEWRAKWDQKAEEMRTRYNKFAASFSEAVNSKLEKILGHRYAQIVIGYLKRTQEKIMATLNKWQLKNKIVKFVKKTYRDLKLYAGMQAKAILDSYMRLENTGFTVYDPRNGEIQFELWLPLELHTLKEFPDINIDVLKQEWAKLKQKYIPESDYSFWDTFYKYKPNMDYTDWIPPFKATAMLTHGRHYTTFDGRNYDFAGTCSYLLTKDFSDRNFSVIVNYDNGKKTSLIVKSNGKEIEIFPDFKVTVDNLRTELPYQHLNTTVLRTGYSIRVHNEKGFTATCDMAHDICTFNVTGWYFGKMAGLLGTYNNEQYDDFLTADRRIESDLEQFARTWEVGTYCHSSRNLARQVTTSKGSEADTVCRRYFENAKSIFRPCFKQVDPEPHLKNCISDIEQDYTSRTAVEKGCGTFANYINVCRRLGVPIRLPTSCVTCSGPDGETYTDGDMKRFESVDKPGVHAADVLFVIEEKKCNIDVASKIADMGVQIDNALRARGLRSNRFAVVGFGGNRVHNIEQSHTMEGQLFNDARKLHLAVNILDFSEDGPNTDILKAVSFAVKYPFRTGVSKNVVVIPCSTCRSQAVGYGEMQQLLSERDITLHVMMDHDFKLKTRSPVKTSYIFGLDERAVFTNKDVNTPVLIGDTVLKNQVLTPKDICVTLAFERNGTVFNIQKMLQGRYSTQKSFLDVFARRLANSAHPTKCQVCECIPDRDGVGRSVCRNCNTPSFNLFFPFLPKQIKSTAVTYDYNTKQKAISPSIEPLTETGFDMDFDEYMKQGRSFETIRSN